MDFLEKQEAQLQRHLSDGDTAAAVRCLFEMVVSQARKKDFRSAEAYRDRLYEVDPMAISEIVRAGDIIEQEKSQALNQAHMQILSDLYSNLNPEETNELYYSLSTIRCDIDHSLFRQGEENQRLFFLEQGEVTLSFQHDGRQMHLKTVGPGGILGGETFFSRTAEATFSAHPLLPVSASVLDGSVLPRWQDSFRGLLATVHDAWAQGYDIPALIEKKQYDRRGHNRRDVSGKVGTQVLNADGKPTSKPFRATLRNISAGGLSFSLQTQKSETAMLLLGRRIAMKCRLPLIDGEKELKKLGRIMAVRPLPFHEYSFHVRFDKPVSEGMIQEVAASPGGGSNGSGLRLEE